MQCWFFNHFTLFMCFHSGRLGRFIEYSMLRLTFQVYFALSFHITSHVHRIHFFVPLCCIGLRFSPCHLEDLVNPLDPPLLWIDITLGIYSRVGTITKSKLPLIFLVLEQHICLNELESNCVPQFFTSRLWLSFCSVFPQSPTHIIF